MKYWTSIRSGIVDSTENEKPIYSGISKKADCFLIKNEK